MRATITKSPFGTLPNGQAVDIYTLTNANGLEARITNYGGIVVSLLTPDRDGKLEDIVLGYETLDEYVKDNPYFGALIGRYGNRIGGAQFTLDDKVYKLAANDGPNHLHGGVKGFDKVVWEAVPDTSKAGAVSLHLTYTSPDMEEGYPGNLDVRVVYSLTDQDELKIQYLTTTDKKTVANLTHHGYFNLSGGVKSDILGHLLHINAGAFTPIDSTLIPLGQIATVANGPFDFRKPKPIGQDIGAADEQIAFGLGYDHNWVLATHDSLENVAAKVVDPVSGRAMEMRTTEPGVQFYSGNFLDGKYKGKGGIVYQDRFGFCLETQHFPDSPNKSQFPITTLNPRIGYQSTTIYRFFVEGQQQ